MRVSLLTAISNILEIIFELDRLRNGRIFLPTCAILAPKRTVLKSRDYDQITISCGSLSVKPRRERAFVCRQLANRF